MSLPSFARPMGRWTHALLAAAVMLAPTVAQAQFLERRPGLAIAQTVLKVCDSDIARVCSGVVPGGGRIAQCLLRQPEQLSSDCRRFIGEFKSAQNTLFACTADARRLCAGTMPGGGRVVACLNRQRDALSRDCARALDEAEQVGR